jgi:fibronectin-binding autotransporter adhesin
MTTGNTALLGLALPVEGELDGTWGDTVNDSITSLVDSAVAGTTTLSADADVTLTDTVLAANQARQAVILWTASNGATTRNITAPARSKAYIVVNAGTGSVVLRGAGPTTGVTIISGERCLAAWNGSDFVKIATSTADGVTTFSAGTTGFTPSTATSGAVTLAGTLATTNGGTGLTAFTANQVFYASSTSAIGQSANLTFDGTTLVANNFTDSSLTSGRVTYAGTGGNLVDSANLTFNGTTLTANALTVTNATTITGGTANGVAYLNGSKVLTTGSALTFDGTTFGVNNGVAGGAALSLTGTYSGSGSVAFLNFQRVGGAVAGTLGYNDASTAIQFGTTTNHSTIFLQNNSEAMRLTSTGLGIGTSSPTARLTVVTSTSSDGVMRLGDNATYYGELSRVNATDEVRLGSYGPSQNLTFYTVNSEKMRLNASGNLGLGVTPSAWDAGFQVLQNSGGALWSGSAAAVRLTQNTYYASSFKYVSSAAASQYAQVSGAHQWFVAPSGTAGNAISFTQAMTLDASGNLGVGTTQAITGSKVSVENAGFSAGSSANSTQTNLLLSGYGYRSGSTTYGNVSIRSSYSNSNNSASLEFYTDPNGASPTERARITSGGDLGIGTTSPTTFSGFRTLEIANSGGSAISLVTGSSVIAQTISSSTNSLVYMGSRSNHALVLTTNDTERARITSGGELLVGTTTVAGSAKLTVNGDISTSGTGTGARLRNQIDGVSVSTSATTIVLGGDIGQLVVINGISGSDRFCDLVMSSTGAAPVVVQSFTALGSPAARTYTRSGSNLQLAMASGTYTVRALSLGS